MIRKAELKDVNIIAQILTTTWKSAYKGIVNSDYSNNLPIEKYIRIFTENINQNKEIIFVNEDKNVNGFISGICSNDNYDCEIIGLYILPEHQRNGIGKQLVAKMLDYFKIQEKHNLIIWTLDGAENNAFYRSIGGSKKEFKYLQIGSQTCRGVGFNIKI